MMTDHILGTEFDYQNLVPVGTGQKKDHVPQKIQIVENLGF